MLRARALQEVAPLRRPRAIRRRRRQRPWVQAQCYARRLVRLRQRVQGRQPLGQVQHPDRQVLVHPVLLQRGRALATAQPVLHLIALLHQQSELPAWKQRRLARPRPRRKARQRERLRRLLEMPSQAAAGPPPPPARRRPQKAVDPPLLAPRARRHRRKEALRRLRHLHGLRLLLKVLLQRRALQRAPTHHRQLLQRQPQARQARRAMPQQRPAQFLRSRRQQQGLRRARHPQRQPRRFSQAPVLLHRRHRRRQQGLLKQLRLARRRRTPRRRMRRVRQG